MNVLSHACHLDMPYKISSHAMYINHGEGLAGKVKLFRSALSANIS